MGERSSFRAVDSTSLGEDVAQVVGNRIEADEQFVSNVLIALAGGEEAQYLHFAFRETRRVNDPALTLLPLRTYDVSFDPK